MSACTQLKQGAKMSSFFNIIIVKWMQGTVYRSLRLVSAERSFSASRWLPRWSQATAASTYCDFKQIRRQGNYCTRNLSPTVSVIEKVGLSTFSHCIMCCISHWLQQSHLYFPLFPFMTRLRHINLTSTIEGLDGGGTWPWELGWGWEISVKFMYQLNVCSVLSCHELNQIQPFC